MQRILSLKATVGNNSTMVLLISDRLSYLIDVVNVIQKTFFSKEIFQLYYILLCSHHINFKYLNSRNKIIHFASKT